MVQLPSFRRSRRSGKPIARKRIRRGFEAFRSVAFEPLEERLPLASTLVAGFEEQLVVTGMTEPSSMTFAPDGRIFVAEKRSGVSVIKNGALLPTRFVTLSVNQSGERGVQSIAFDPNYDENGYVYVYYTHRPSNSDRLSRFTANPANPDVALPGETILLDNIPTIDPGYHNGGLMKFGADGMMYLAIGDLLVPGNVQDLSKINGKVLRLDVGNYDGTAASLIPVDNPYVNTPGARPEIYAYGVRNPYSGDVLPGTNTIFINDVGAGGWEEINLLSPGANYGWPTNEGANNPPFTTPIYTYEHPDDEGSAIAGGSFYTGSMFPSQYAGTYFFSDYVQSFIKNYNPATGQVTEFATNVFIPTDVEQGPDGALYWVSHGSGGQGIVGGIYRIVFSSGANQAPTAVANATSSTNGNAPLTVGFSGAGSSDPNGDSLTYSWDFGDGTMGSGVTVSHTYTTNGTYSVRLTVNDRTDGSGLSNTSQPIIVTVGNRAPTGTIDLPVPSTRYAGGSVISFSGTGTDPDDGELTATAFHWSVVFHHNTHTHPFIDAIDGVKSGTFEIPLTGEVDPDQWYRLHLTVTDSGGLQHSSFFDVLPQTSTFTLATNTAGLSLELDSTPHATPTTITGVVNMTRTLSAPLTQIVGGETYNFVSWSDSGAATHTISTPASATTYTAFYTSASGNSPPAAGTDSATAAAEKPVTIAVLANDTDPDNDLLSVTTVTQGAHGAVVLNANNTVTYTPNVGYLGGDTFTYTVSDGRGGAGTGVVNVTVRGIYLFSTTTAGTLTGTTGGGVTFTEHDILQLTVDAGGQSQYQMYFDGSDVGLTTATENIDAFAFLPDGSLVVSTAGAFSVTGAGGVTISGSGEDLLRFVPTSTGNNTAGTWSMYFDGSDVGLSGTAENVDALAILLDGRILVSLAGNFNANGVTGQDEDLILFQPSSLGVTTAGTWSMYFDGTDVNLATSPAENIVALDVREGPTPGAEPTLFFVTSGAFAVPGVSGQNEDIFAFSSTSTGPNTAGAYAPALVLDGSLHGLSSFALDGMHLGLPTAPPVAVASATSPTSGTAPLTVNFSGAGSSSPSGEPLTYTWDFGDGTTGTGVTVSHTYAVGNYSATLTVTAGIQSATSQPIAISAAGTGNTPPVAGADNVSTSQDQAITIVVLSNDNDADDDPLTVTSVTQGQNGTVVLNGDNTVRYTPETGFLGADTFGYTISDGRGGTAGGTVNVTVRGIYFFSTDIAGTLAGTTGGSVSFSEADILQLIVDAGGQYEYQLYFDGSDVGLSDATENVDAFAFLADGSLVISTTGAYSVPGGSGTIAGGGEDLLRFVPTSTGSTTAGTWSMYFDGSDVGLSGGTAENVDAVTVLSDGRILLSLSGNWTAIPGVFGQDEDLALFQPTSLGDTTAGSWQLYFDGTDVSMATSPNENVVGVHARESSTPGAGPTLYLVTIANFSVPGLSGQNEDIFAFNPTTTGPDTSGTYGPGLTLDGSLYGLEPFILDDIHVGTAPAVSGAASSALSAPGPGLSTQSQNIAILSASYATTAPERMTAGRTVTYLIKLTNTDSQTWSNTGANRVRLGLYFDGKSDALGAWSSEPRRLNLPKSVAPGESVMIEVKLTAPPRGTYVLRQRLVMSDDTWFSGLCKTNVTVC